MKTKRTKKWFACNLLHVWLFWFCTFWWCFHLNAVCSWNLRWFFHKNIELNILFMAKTCFHLKTAHFIHFIYGTSVYNSCPLLNGIYRLQLSWLLKRPPCRCSWHERKFSLHFFGHSHVICSQMTVCLWTTLPP